MQLIATIDAVRLVAGLATELRRSIGADAQKLVELEGAVARVGYTTTVSGRQPIRSDGEGRRRQAAKRRGCFARVRDARDSIDGRNEVKLKPAAAGTYIGPGNVMMVGKWNVTVSVKQGGKEVGQKRRAAVAREGTPVGA